MPRQQKFFDAKIDPRLEERKRQSTNNTTRKRRNRNYRHCACKLSFSIKELHNLSTSFIYSLLQDKKMSLSRTCAECGAECLKIKFTSSQWVKGNGYSRCTDCVQSSKPHACRKCQRTFATKYELVTHQQAHRRRTPVCSFCGEKRVKVTYSTGFMVYNDFVYSGVSDAAYRKTDEVYRKIYEHACKRYAMEPSNDVQSTSTGYDYSQGVPSEPDSCYDCSRVYYLFRQLTILLEHSKQGQKQAAPAGIQEQPKSNQGAVVTILPNV